MADKFPKNTKQNRKQLKVSLIQEGQLIPIRINLNKIYALKQHRDSTDTHRYGEGLNAAGSQEGASSRNRVQPESRRNPSRGSRETADWHPQGTGEVTQKSAPARSTFQQQDGSVLSRTQTRGWSHQQTLTHRS